MKNKKSIIILERILEETENAKRTEKELDQSLREINIDPNELVEVGLKKIGKLLDKKDKNVTPLHAQFPIAANKQKADLDRLKKDMLKEKVKNSKFKKK